MFFCRSYWRSWRSIHSLCRTEAGLLAVPRGRRSCTACPAASSWRGTSAWPSPRRPAKPTGHTHAPAPGRTARNLPPGLQGSPAARTGRRCHLHLLRPLFLTTTHLLPLQPRHALWPQSPSLESSHVHANAAGLPLTPFPQPELMKASWIYLIAPSWWSGSRNLHTHTYTCTLTHTHEYTHTHTLLVSVAPTKTNNGETSRQGCREGIKNKNSREFTGVHTAGAAAEGFLDGSLQMHWRRLVRQSSTCLYSLCFCNDCRTHLLTDSVFCRVSTFSQCYESKRYRGSADIYERNLTIHITDVIYSKYAKQI